MSDFVGDGACVTHHACDCIRREVEEGRVVIAALRAEAERLKDGPAARGVRVDDPPTDAMVEAAAKAMYERDGANLQKLAEGDWWAVMLIWDRDPDVRRVIVTETLAEAEAERQKWQAEDEHWWPRVMRIDAHQHPVGRGVREDEGLREALAFYANDDRYAYDETCCHGTYLSVAARKALTAEGPNEAVGVLEDDGAIARAALAAVSPPPEPETAP